MTMHERARLQAFKNVKERKKVSEMTREERLSLIAFKNVMEKKKVQETIYLTEAHKKNSEAAMKQIADWKKTPSTLKSILEKQKNREK